MAATVRKQPPPNVLFRYKGALSNANTPCTQCDRVPEKRQRFLVCTGCKARVYCSRECQRHDWAVHRDACKDIQEAEADSDGGAAGTRKSDVDWSAPSGWESLKRQHRLILFTKFLHLHNRSINRAIQVLRVALRPSGKILDVEREAITLTFKYRTDNEGNPAKMFSFVGACLKPRLDDETIQPAGVKDQLKQMKQEALREGWTEPLRVCLQVEDLAKEFVWAGWTIAASVEPRITRLAENTGRRCLNGLKKLVWNGVVLGGEGYGAGLMVRKGRYWTWEKL